MPQSEVFLQPADDASQMGKGTAADPIRVHPEPGDFDDWMRILMRRPEIAKVTLLGGEYVTLGPWAYSPPHYSMITRPLVFQGTEASPPVIKLSSRAIFETGGKPRPDTQVLHVGRLGGDVPGIQFRHLVIDGNEASLPADKMVTAGIQVWGSKALLEDLVIRNLRGSLELQHEAFGVLLRAYRDTTHNGPNGGSTLRRLSIFNDGGRSRYFSAIHAAYTDAGRGSEMTTVEHCHAFSTGDRPSRAAFLYGSKVTYRACTATGYSYGPYVDFKEAKDVLYHACVWDKIAHCAVHISSDGAARRDVTISECVFQFAPREGTEMIGVEIRDLPNLPPSKIENIRVKGCTFKVVGEHKRPFVVYSLSARYLSNSSISLCTFPDRSTQNVVGDTPQLSPGKVNPSVMELVSCRTTSGREIRDLPRLRDFR